MPSISELLSPSNLNNLISKEITKGCVFRMHLNTAEGVTGKNPGDDGRNKYFVVIGTTTEGNLVGFLLVNSNINPRLSDEIKDLHYPIYAKDHPFLERDSFVDCSRIKEIKQEKFSAMFDKDFKKGHINENDLELIIGAVKSSELVTNKQLKKYGLL